MIFSNPRVAPAVGTEAFTERQVNIQADPFFFRSLKSMIYLFTPSFSGKCGLIPKRDSRITGISRSGHIIFSNNSALITSDLFIVSYFFAQSYRQQHALPTHFSMPQRLRFRTVCSASPLGLWSSNGALAI